MVEGLSSCRARVKSSAFGGLGVMEYFRRFAMPDGAGRPDFESQKIEGVGDSFRLVVRKASGDDEDSRRGFSFAVEFHGVPDEAVAVPGDEDTLFLRRETKLIGIGDRLSRA